jgi:hypothetical protein
MILVVHSPATRDLPAHIAVGGDQCRKITGTGAVLAVKAIGGAR